MTYTSIRPSLFFSSPEKGQWPVLRVLFWEPGENTPWNFSRSSCLYLVVSENLRKFVHVFCMIF